MAAIYQPNTNATLANRDLISASNPVVQNPDSAPFGGTINGLGGETPILFFTDHLINGILIETSTWNGPQCLLLRTYRLRENGRHRIIFAGCNLPGFCGIGRRP